MGKSIYSLFFFVFLISFQPLAASDTHTIYVSSISWHTGLVIPGDALPEGLWKEGHDYSDVPYVEIGWGDADFYPSDRFNFWYAFKSIFWPTPSVLHFNPIRQPVEDYYHDTRVVKLELTQEQLDRLVNYLLREMKLDEAGHLIPVTPGFYVDSYFYQGSRSYYFPKNSNVWVARAIEQAGFSLNPMWLQTTGWVLNKMEEFGELVVERE